MPEPLHARKPVPLRVLRVIDIQAQRLAGIIAPPAEQHHAAVHEHGRVLIPPLRQRGAVLIGRDHPVPLAVAVFPESPGVVQRGLLLPPPPEHHDHPVRGALSAQTAGVVRPGPRALRTLHPFPLKRVPLHIQDPHVVDRLLPRVAAEHDQMRPVVDDGVAVALPGRGALHGHQAPGGGLLAEVEQVEVVGGEVPPAGRARKDHEQVPVDRAGRVRGARRGRVALGLETVPGGLGDVEEEGLVGEAVAARVAGGLELKGIPRRRGCIGFWRFG